MAGLDSTTQITVTFPQTGSSYRVWVESTGEPESRGANREIFSNTWTESKGEWNFLCAWDDRIGIALNLLGGSLVVGGVPVYALPVGYPDVNKWACKRMYVAGDGLISQGSTFLSVPQRARCKAVFGIPDYGTSDTMAGELQMDFATNAVSLDQTAPTFKWASDGAIIPSVQVPTFNVSTTIVTLTLYNRSVLPSNLVSGLVGGCNQSTFQGYAAETVAFRGARSTRKVTTGGVLNYDIQLVWEVAAGSTAGGWTWNQRFRPGVGWANVVLIGSGSKLYTPVNFTPLLA